MFFFSWRNSTNIICDIMSKYVIYMAKKVKDFLQGGKRQINHVFFQHKMFLIPVIFSESWMYPSD